MGRRYVFLLLFFVPCLLVFPPQLAARIPLPKGTEDVRDLFASATLVFHGRVLNVESPEHRSIEEDVKHFDWDARNNQARVATFQVDRWYKGSSQLSTVKLQFYYGADAINGHDCIDLHQNTTWLVLARQRGDGLLEFSDDCEGGLPVSSVLAPSNSEDGVPRLQRDLIAGLEDQNSILRLENIKRLGGLKLRSSNSALQPFVDHGSQTESKWAIYAMFRSGDTGVLPQVEQLLTSPFGAHSMPESWMALELRFLTDRRAVPTLIALLQSTSSSSVVWASAIAALDEIKDPRSLPSLALHLSDKDRYVSFGSLAAISAITQAPACAPPGHPDEHQRQLQLRLAKCENWWKTQGRLRKWPD